MSNVSSRPEKDCPTCGEHFVCVRPEQKYCSRKCIPAKGRKHNVCPCGVNTGSYQKKYCTPEHRERWGGKKPPARLVTHVCIGCGKPFDRPWFYPGKTKYCSNKCSHSEVKKVRDKFIADLPEGAVVFHSGWEVRFVAACMRLEIPWRRYDGPDIETSQGIYRPDFIVAGSAGDVIGDTVIEIKGWEDRPGTPEKLAESGVLVIGKKHLEVLEGCSYADSFWRVLEMIRKAPGIDPHVVWLHSP